jgi:RimJ/RimL family protein N-acetyltransferase
VPLRLDLDGPVSIRPIRGDDHDRLRDSHERLSPESRYRRFLAAKPQLTLADARYLVEIDGCDHFALVATLPEAEGEPIVGVARFIRLPSNREVAEVAIVVNDAYQRRGMGADLVGGLAEAAVARGVRRFRATMLADNLAIRRLLENLAAGPVERLRLGELLEIEFALPGADAPGEDCGDAALAAV